MPRDRRAVIGTGLWFEDSIRGLTRRQQQAYLLAYTQPDVNRCGVLAYRLRSWAGLFSDGNEDELHEDFLALHTSKHVVLDTVDEQLFIRTYVRHDGLLTQPMVVAAMVRAYFNITSLLIRQAFLVEIRRLYDVVTDPKEHQGLELVVGANPTDLGIKNAGQVTTAIGSGLVEALSNAIAKGTVEPFDSATLPKGLTEGQRKGLAEGPPGGIDGGLADPPLDPQGQGRARVSVTVPVPVTTPVTVSAPTSEDPPPNDDPTGALLIEHANAYAKPIPPSALAPVRTAIARLVAEHVAPDRIRDGLTRMRERQVGPKLLPQLVAETTPTNGGSPSRPSTTDQRVRDARNVAADLRAQGM